MGEILAQIQEMAYLSHGPDVTSNKLIFFNRIRRKFNTVNLCTSDLLPNTQNKVRCTIDT